MTIDVAILGASTISKTGTPKIQASTPVDNDDDDTDSFGQLDLFQSLGVTSVPWPKDKDGYAEGAVARGAGNRDGIIVGARDTRTANVVGNIEPGDTIVHSTGPAQAAQVQLKEKRRQVAIVTKRKNDEGIAIVLDGVGDSVQILAFGAVFEMKPGEITMSNGRGATIALQGGNICLMGNVVLGAAPNPAMRFMIGPMAGSPGGSAAAPLMAAKGIYPGV